MLLLLFMVCFRPLLDRLNQTKMGSIITFVSIANKLTVNFVIHRSLLDITSERSFLNAREWMTSAKDVISVDRNYSATEMESIVFMLVGNKLD